MHATADQVARQGLAGQGGASKTMFPIAHFAPLYVDALGTAIAGIAAAIAGAIAVRIFGAKQRQAAPAARAGAGAARAGEAARDDERAPVERPPAPPARIRLALPPEARSEDEMEPRLQTADQPPVDPRDQVASSLPDAPDTPAAR